jgi:hypothetical protein
LPLVLATAMSGTAAHAGACGEPATAIAAVQGRAARSPLLDRAVEIEAVVVGNFQRGLGGYFVQAPAAEQDRDPATSEGLYVLAERPRAEIRTGRRVRVRGRVVEHEHVPGLGGTLTALLPQQPVLDCGDGGWIAPLILREPPPDWERHEGMRLALPGPLTVIGNAALLKYGELEVSLAGRLYQPTEQALPGRAARERARADLRARLTLDDNRRSEFPRGIWYLDAPVSAAHPWRHGTELGRVEGVLDEQRGYRLQLTTAPAAVRQAPRPAPPALDAELRLASFNVLNLFNGDGRGGGFPTRRGAADRAEYERQRAKLVAAITALGPDVAALMELENDGYGPEGSLAQLVRALNAALGGAGDYRYVKPGTPRLGSDEIAVGLIYRERRVRALSRPAHLDAGAFRGGNRVPLAQAFEPVAGGTRFVVVANHFKSKGCAEATPPDTDQQDGQGCWNATRTRAARELATWLGTDPTGAGTVQVLILGDLNAHGREDPVRALLGAGYVDLLAPRAGEPPGYSFVYDALAGRLDHALATPALAERVTGAREWHINADELEAFDYRRTGPSARADGRRYQPDPFRSSDHDPLLIGLRRR